MKQNRFSQKQIIAIHGSRKQIEDCGGAPSVTAPVKRPATSGRQAWLDGSIGRPTAESAGGLVRKAKPLLAQADARRRYAKSKALENMVPAV
jgi:hypothetical protein